MLLQRSYKLSYEDFRSLYEWSNKFSWTIQQWQTDNWQLMHIKLTRYYIITNTILSNSIWNTWQIHVISNLLIDIYHFLIYNITQQIWGINKTSSTMMDLFLTLASSYWGPHQNKWQLRRFLVFTYKTLDEDSSLNTI